MAIPATHTVKQLTLTACEKLGLTQGDRYALRHGRTFLSPVCSLNLSGLVSGAKLDLALDTAATGQSFLVKVALQYVGGQCGPMARIALEFPPDISLWILLTRFQEQARGALILLIPDGPSACFVPHLLILGQEFMGPQQLASTSLSSLGVCQGTCLVRMSHKRIAQSLQDIEGELPTIGSMEQATVPEVERDDGPIGRQSRVPLAPQPSALSSLPSAIVAPADSTSARDRRAVLYAPPSTANLKASPDLPEGHYEMNPGEFRAHWAAQQAHTRALLESPLLSQAKLRERRQREFLEKHPTTALRFRFPDQYVIEATFDSTETIFDLFAFIGSSLTRALPFALSTGPPPKALARSDQTPLWRCDLVPAAIINVAWSGNTGTPFPRTINVLQPEVTATLTDLPSPQSTGEVSLSSDRLSSDSLTTPRQPAGAMKKPSWLRL